jgi:hypothetical protein
MNPSYLRHLQSADALVTSPSSKYRLRTIVAIEDQRSKRDIELRARVLEYKVNQASTPDDLLHMPEVEGGLLTAAGFSHEALLRFDQVQRRQIMVDFVENVLRPAGSSFVEALLTHFVEQSVALAQITPQRSMQAWSQRQLAQCVVSELNVSGRTFQWLHRGYRRWQAGTTLWDCMVVEALAWAVEGRVRILVFDFLAPFIPPEYDVVAAQANGDAGPASHNIDICLLHSTPEQYRSKTKRPTVVRDAETYVALGELKGGIDPAGADEHWKTANAHLGRIRRSFGALGALPHLFFVGNAIEASMAGEIWNQLQSGELSNAANLTDNSQTMSLIAWLCKL